MGKGSWEIELDDSDLWVLVVSDGDDRTRAEGPMSWPQAKDRRAALWDSGSYHIQAVQFGLIDELKEL